MLLSTLAPRAPKLTNNRVIGPSALLSPAATGPQDVSPVTQSARTLKCHGWLPGLRPQPLQ
eukprot:15445954-Alexandrium_andersonii.AAC.1